MPSSSLQALLTRANAALERGYGAEAAYGKGAEHRDDARAARSSRSTVSASPTGSAASRPPSSPTDELPAGAES